MLAELDETTRRARVTMAYVVILTLGFIGSTIVTARFNLGTALTGFELVAFVLAVVSTLFGWVALVMWLYASGFARRRRGQTAIAPVTAGCISAAASVLALVYSAAVGNDFAAVILTLQLAWGIGLVVIAAVAMSVIRRQGR